VERAGVQRAAEARALSAGMEEVPALAKPVQQVRQARVALQAPEERARQAAGARAERQVAQARVELPARQMQDQAGLAVQADRAAVLASPGQGVPRVAKVELPVLLEQRVPRAKVALPAQAVR